MRIFTREAINTKRQFEFDFAKFICILGMVIIHCFEELLADTGSTSSLYYVFVVVLDCVFGAGTFMSCMGLGISYGYDGNANKIIKRGFLIFLLGYGLNIFREGIPFTIFALLNHDEDSFRIIVSAFLNTDILQFAGLSLMLFGLLKKLKINNLFIFLISLVMSIVGSFIRFIDFGNLVINLLSGLFIGTYTEGWPDYCAAFPLLNWFIVVVSGYLFANAFKHCQNKKKFYAIFSPIAGLIIAIYLIITIPNKFDMMSGDLLYYYHFATPDLLIIASGFIFASGLYYFISLLFNERIKKFITKISVNINSIYCIHWIIIGWICGVLYYLDSYFENELIPVLISIPVFVASALLANVIKKKKDKCRILKIETN